MFIARALLTVLCIVTVSSHSGFAGNADASKKEQLLKSLQDMVSGILKGTALKDATAHVDAEAYVIDGKYFESMLGVLNGEPGHCGLIEGKDMRVSFQSVSVMENYSAAFMILKTETAAMGERFHSVVFFHDPGAEWKIKSWHISN